MFNNVIVGVDGKDGGRDAIALATVLRDKEGGDLTLGYVYPGEPHPWRGSSSAYEAAQFQDACDLLENAREQAGIEARIRWRGSPSAGRGLHELAEEVGADLLVVGSSRRGLLGRVLVGDDSRAALDGARCAVAIAPTSYGAHRVDMREIGVGYDGSPESEHALDVARTLAAARHSRLSAFEAVSVPSSYHAAWAWVEPETIEELVDAARDRVAGLEGVEPHAAYGVASEELALYSASLDLLVIGSRSYAPLGRLVHGSTAQDLARTARCPLLVMTRASRKADATEGSEAKLEGAAAGTSA
jgi:nucleotide-binding universal stress UspA family protein